MRCPKFVCPFRYPNLLDESVGVCWRPFESARALANGMNERAAWIVVQLDNSELFEMYPERRSDPPGRLSGSDPISAAGSFVQESVLAPATASTQCCTYIRIILLN
jgi:hypothetical protein